MKITLAAIGRAKAGPESDLFALYRERLPWPITLVEKDVKSTQHSAANVAQRKAQEAEFLLHSVRGCACVIALDERGRDLGSEAFAQWIGRHKDQGVGHIGLIIGGADGLDETVRTRAQLVWSLGRLTWPHMLVRGLVAEQLYRAYAILHNHPYHRG